MSSLTGRSTRRGAGDPPTSTLPPASSPPLREAHTPPQAQTAAVCLICPSSKDHSDFSPTASKNPKRLKKKDKTPRGRQDGLKCTVAEKHRTHACRSLAQSCTPRRGGGSASLSQLPAGGARARSALGQVAREIRGRKRGLPQQLQNEPSRGFGRRLGGGGGGTELAPLQ